MIRGLVRSDHQNIDDDWESFGKAYFEARSHELVLNSTVLTRRLFQPCPKTHHAELRELVNQHAKALQEKWGRLLDNPPEEQPYFLQVKGGRPSLEATPTINGEQDNIVVLVHPGYIHEHPIHHPGEFTAAGNDEYLKRIRALAGTLTDTERTYLRFIEEDPLFENEKHTIPLPLSDQELLIVTKNHDPRILSIDSFPEFRQEQIFQYLRELGITTVYVAGESVWRPPSVGSHIDEALPGCVNYAVQKFEKNGFKTRLIRDHVHPLNAPDAGESIIKRYEEAVPLDEIL